MLFKNYKDLLENGKEETIKKIRKDILDIFSYSLKSIDPYKSVKKRFFENNMYIDSKSLDLSVFKNIYLVSFGKASIGMAQAVCDSIKSTKGIVVTNEKKRKVKNKNIQTFVGSHPLPDENSIKGTEKIIDLVKNCKKDDLLIVLISGGGSALLCKPRVNLKDMQKITELLLKSGANINEINTIRKHLSYVKGGQLAKYANCRIISFVISDIIGDPLDFIASGPTYPDSTTFNDAIFILEKYNLWDEIPNSAKNVLKKGKNGEIPETPDVNDFVLKKVDNTIVANNTLVCTSAEEKARELGYKTMLLTTKLEGEARNIGNFLVDKITNYKMLGDKMVFISGGETTVTIKGDGKGGRNQEMVLSSVKKISGTNIVFSSFATDGVDGNSNAAGAISDKNSFDRALKKNLDPDLYLKNNNSYEFFKKLNDLFITGPSGTNVMDLQIIVKYKK